MSHRIYEGEVYHHRFVPKVHQFTYPFFLLDIDVANLATLQGKFFSFSAKDHFGSHDDFEQNIAELLEKFDLKGAASVRFLTLPRIFRFVFNPLSVVVLFDANDTPFYILAEVHNYNGGRIVYPVKLIKQNENYYTGEVHKEMYVSPFLQREGEYKFTMHYTKNELKLTITLHEEGVKTLLASLHTKAVAFTPHNERALFFKHLFITFRVVTRTLWQSLKLYLKGIKFYSVTPQDQVKRY
ncbi:MAG: DUF1365 domain-containing protein [Sulfurospirillum sp.]|nr:DUF1365 domain-containing protein [Sulfurospirillum sp.]